MLDSQPSKQCLMMIKAMQTMLCVIFRQKAQRAMLRAASNRFHPQWSLCLPKRVCHGKCISPMCLRLRSNEGFGPKGNCVLMCVRATEPAQTADSCCVHELASKVLQLNKRKHSPQMLTCLIQGSTCWAGLALARLQGAVWASR